MCLNVAHLCQWDNLGITATNVRLGIVAQAERKIVKVNVVLRDRCNAIQLARVTRVRLGIGICRCIERQVAQLKRRRRIATADRSDKALQRIRVSFETDCSNWTIRAIARLCFACRVTDLAFFQPTKRFLHSVNGNLQMIGEGRRVQVLTHWHRKDRSGKAERQCKCFAKHVAMRYNFRLGRERLPQEG